MDNMGGTIRLAKVKTALTMAIEVKPLPLKSLTNPSEELSLAESRMIG